MINRIGNYKLFRWKDGSRILHLRVDGPHAYYRAPDLSRRGWEPFFIGVHGNDYTVWSYRKAAKS
jgi:hypothetical protein